MSHAQKKAWTMKHPALAKAFAVALAVMSLVLLFAGVKGFETAEEENAERLRYEKKFSERIANYTRLSERLENSITYDELWNELEKEIEQHDEDASQHKTDLAMHTAEKGGYKMGADMIWEAVPNFNESRKQLAISKFMLEEKAPLIEQLREIVAQLGGFETAISSCDRLITQLGLVPPPDETELPEDEKVPEGSDEEMPDGSDEKVPDGSGGNVPEGSGENITDGSDEKVPEDSDGNVTEGSGENMADGSDEEVPDGSGGNVPEGSGENITDGSDEKAPEGSDGNIPDSQGENVPEGADEKGIADSNINNAENIVGEPLPELAVQDAFIAFTGENPEVTYGASSSSNTSIVQNAFAKAQELAMGLRSMGIEIYPGLYGENEYEQAQGLIGTLFAIQSAYEQLLSSVEQQAGMSLADMRAAIKEYDEGVAAIAMGEIGLNAAWGALENIWYELGQLEEEHEDLIAIRDMLDEEAARLSKEALEADELHELENDRISAKLLLTSVKEVNDMYAESDDLVGSAEKYLQSYKAETESLRKGRVVSCILAVIGGIAGIAALPAAYELIHKRFWLIWPVVISIICAAASEAIYYKSVHEMWYVGLFAAIIALLHLLIVAPKEKKPVIINET